MGRVRDSLQAAFSAVEGDILETNFASLEQALTSTLVDSVDVLNGEPSADSPRIEKPQAEGPPKLSKDSDDIFWMSKLHGALLQVNGLQLKMRPFLSKEGSTCDYYARVADPRNHQSWSQLGRALLTLCIKS